MGRAPVRIIDVSGHSSGSLDPDYAETQASTAGLDFYVAIGGEIRWSVVPFASGVPMASGAQDCAAVIVVKDTDESGTEIIWRPPSSAESNGDKNTPVQLQLRDNQEPGDLIAFTVLDYKNDGADELRIFCRKGIRR